MLGNGGAYAKSFYRRIGTLPDSPRLLKEKDVMSPPLYQKLKGLGGFRNVLVHEYIRVDISLLSSSLTRAFDTFPAFSSEIREWLKNER